MTWTGDVARQIRAEFHSAQRRARGIIDRVSDESEPAEIGPRLEPKVDRRRRIVT